MASEQDGLLHQKEILTKKLNYLRKEYAIASDASQKFTLQMQIAEVEKEIEAIDVKMNIQDKTQMPDAVNVSKKSIANKKIDRKLFIKILITIITVLAALMGFVKDFRDFFFPPSDETTIVTPTNATNKPATDSVKLDTPIIKKPERTSTTPSQNPAPVKEIIPITLIVNAEFENAEISVNGTRVYPSAGSTPTFKKVNIKYNVAGYKVVLKMANKTCTKQFSITENELNNPITIPVSCTN